MKLTDLFPRWSADYDILIGTAVVHDEDRRGMGLSFDCPHCVAAGLPSQFGGAETSGPYAQRLGVFFANPIDGKPHTDDYDAAHLWTRTGEAFDTLTLTPSIDASNYGHWHGVVAGGCVS